MKKALVPIAVFTTIVVLVLLFLSSLSNIGSIEDDLIDLTNDRVNEEFGISERNELCKLLNIDYVSDFSEGIAFALNNYQITYIDNQGRQIFSDSSSIDPQQYFPEDLPEAEEDFSFFNLRGAYRDTYGIDFTPLDIMDIPKYKNDFLVFQKSDGYYIVNKAGIFLNKEPYLYAENFSDNLALVETQDGFNFISRSGNIISPRYYTDANSFENGVAIVSNSNGYFLINNKLEIISGYYEFIDSFNDGYAPAKKINGKTTLIKTDGTEVAGTAYDSILDYSEGIWITIDTGAYGYISNEGNIIDLGLDRTTLINVAYPFKDDIAVVQLKNGGNKEIDAKYIFINKEGKKITDELFHDAYDFNFGYAVVELSEGVYTYIDKEGKRITQDTFYFAYPFSENGIALVQGNDELYYFINTNGEMIGSDKYIDAYSFENNQAQVVTGGDNWYLINSNGEKITSAYNYIDNFYNDIALVEKKNGRYTYINKQGKEITQSDFTFGFSFFSGLGKVTLDDGGERYLLNNGQFFCN